LREGGADAAAPSSRIEESFSCFLRHARLTFSAKDGRSPAMRRIACATTASSRRIWANITACATGNSILPTAAASPGAR